MVFRYIIKKKYIKMLRETSKNTLNLQKISRRSNIHYLMVRKVFIQLQEEEIIFPIFNNPEYEKRDYIPELTQKGKEILGLLEKIIRVHNKNYKEVI